MANDLVAISHDRKYDGKAMIGLTDRQRSFVLKMLEQGINPKGAAKAARELGMNANYGYELMRNDNILAALREEATKRLSSGALAGINVLLEIAQTPGHKEQFRAAKELAALNGFTAEQRIVVEHISEDTKGQMRRIRAMASELGLDPEQLIRGAGIVDAEFTEVTSAVPTLPEVDDSDW